jgi:hypothetical protein
MPLIMPPGYSLPQRRKRLGSELRQARAGDLAKANDKERAQIEKEIKAEVEKQFGWRRFIHRSGVPACWGV